MIRYLYASELARHPGLARTMFRDRADQFRTRFGWEVEVREMPAGPYHLFKSGAEYRAGMRESTADTGGPSPAWTPFLAVAGGVNPVPGVKQTAMPLVRSLMAR